MIEDLNGITAFDQYLDDKVSSMYKDQPLAQDWARISKVIEELGESIQAFIGCTGQNPRKGFTNQYGDVTNELSDTLITCVLAIQHFTKNSVDTNHIIWNRWIYRKMKAGIK